MHICMIAISASTMYDLIRKRIKLKKLLMPIPYLIKSSLNASFLDTSVPLLKSFSKSTASPSSSSSSRRLFRPINLVNFFYFYATSYYFIFFFNLLPKHFWKKGKMVVNSASLSYFLILITWTTSSISF